MKVLSLTIAAAAITSCALGQVSSALSQGKQFDGKVLDFGLGENVGQCLLVRCEVFRGYLLSTERKHGTPLEIRIAEPMMGDHTVDQIAQIPYSEEINLKSPFTTGRVWRGVNLSVNSELTIVRPMVQLLWIPPGYPMYVTSDRRNSDLIRAITRESILLDSSADAISNRVLLLRAQPDPAVAGLIYAYLAHREFIAKPELMATLLLQMIGTASVPQTVRSEMERMILADYFRLKSNEKAEVVRGFAGFGEMADRKLSVLGFDGLFRIAKSDSSSDLALGEEIKARLAVAYRANVEEGLMQRDQVFEKKAGVPGPR